MPEDASAEIDAVVGVALHWRKALGSFQYSLPELAQTLRECIFSASGRDIFAVSGPVGVAAQPTGLPDLPAGWEWAIDTAGEWHQVKVAGQPTDPPKVAERQAADRCPSRYNYNNKEYRCTLTAPHQDEPIYGFAAVGCHRDDDSGHFWDDAHSAVAAGAALPTDPPKDGTE